MNETDPNFSRRERVALPPEAGQGIPRVFAGFKFFTATHVLLRDNQKVRLGGRAAAILAFLIERAGEPVTLGHMAAAVWPGSSIEDISVMAHVASLRRALGDDDTRPAFIERVDGGFRFIATLVP